MKQSTCRCFHRANEFPFIWKSTRRAATSAGGVDDAFRFDALKRQRERRHRNAVRIVCMNDVGLQPA